MARPWQRSQRGRRAAKITQAVLTGPPDPHEFPYLDPVAVAWRKPDAGHIGTDGLLPAGSFAIGGAPLVPDSSVGRASGC